MKLTVRWDNNHREREHRVIRGARVILIVFGILALGLCALAYLGALTSQLYEQREFERSLAMPEAVRPPREANAVSRLEIPRLGISVMVHEGVQSRTLSLGAGHIPGTANPQDDGNIGIAAHRDTYFRGLRKIREQDAVFLSTLEGTYQYSVEWIKIVKPSDNEVLASSDEPVLTLVTCYPFYYVGSAPDRFVVRARRIGWTQ